MLLRRGCDTSLPSMQHVRRPVISLILAAWLGSGCFSPELPDQIACGEGDTCPPGLRCETSADICVPEDQAAVVDLAYRSEPATVEAQVVAPPVAVELRNAAGELVEISGGTFAVELGANPEGVHLLG